MPADRTAVESLTEFHQEVEDEMVNRMQSIKKRWLGTRFMGLKCEFKHSDDNTNGRNVEKRKDIQDAVPRLLGGVRWLKLCVPSSP